jgi:uncharacterized protein
MKHPDFGDLNRHNAVQIGQPFLNQGYTFQEKDDIIINLTLTGQCYARCEGCINKGITFASDKPRPISMKHLESDPERDAALIIKMAGQYPGRKVVLAFYGGEPFLAVDKMEKIRLLLDDSRLKDGITYMVYTNGELLGQALDRFPDLVQAIWLYSVSIDGDEDQHCRVRPGTDLNKIVANLRQLRTVYSGDILLWSTLRESQSVLNCFDQFLELYREGLVNHFFWHWADTSEPYRDFETYASLYGREMEQVMEAYVEQIARGELLPIAHINELVLYLITGKERGHTACAVELARNFDIMAGKIYACADLPPDVGEIKDIRNPGLTRDALNPLIHYKAWLGCGQCGVHSYCGGRCPVQAISGSRDRTLQICQLMRLHVGIVQKKIGEIKDAMTKNGISPQDIYDRSAFISRYTDVVP